MSYPNTKLFINGQWCEAIDKKILPVFDPATGIEIGSVASAGRKDLDDALLAADAGFNIWRKYTAIERSVLMRRAATLLRERSHEIANVLTQEQGKPISEARLEVLAAADTIEWMADEGMRIYGRIVPGRNIAVSQLVFKEPVGPVAAFTPWNFPVIQVVRKLSAALTTGCSIIIKAPEETPASPAALVQAFIDAGIPDGVIGLVFGEPSEISSYLISHPIIKKVTFTGSAFVGKQLASLAGSHMKRVTMELGGHAPVILCEDANIELALKTLVGAKFRNAGQVCISPSRFFVHKSIAKDFISSFSIATAEIKVGHGLESDTKMGPLANSRRKIAMKSFVEDAVARGANVLVGGKGIGESGNYFSPTVLENVPSDARLFNEEPFGPIAAFQTFESLENVINEANRLPFGLASYAYTSNLKNTHQISQDLNVGLLWVNQSAVAVPEMPFGGVKDSGYGSEGGHEALEAYLSTKSVSIMNV